MFDALTREALQRAETADFEGVPLRVVSAPYVAAFALGTGRGKDLRRVLALLESGGVTRNEIAALATRHGLAEARARTEARLLDD